MFLAQAMNEDRSCQKAVNDAAVKRIIGGLSPCSTNTSAYCQARQRLPLKMVSTLVRATGDMMNNQIPEQWRWHGKRVHLIDGTTVNMPDTAANQAIYPQQSGQKPGLGFPLCRIVGVICLSSGAVLNAAMGSYSGKGASEQSLLRTLLDTFKSNDLIVGDAFYGTYFLLATLLNKNIDAVFEQQGARKRVTDFRKGQHLGQKDHLIKLTKPVIKPDWMTQEDYNKAPAVIVLRELKVNGKILITMWVYFLAYNLIRLLMAQSALLADVLPRQLSFKHTVQLWLTWGQQTQAVGIQADEELLFILITQKKLETALVELSRAP